MTRLDGYPADPDEVDVWTVDRLLDGSIEPSDAPDGYEQVAALITVIREGVGPAASGWGSPTVPAMARAITAPPHRRSRRSGAAHARRLSHVAAAAGMFALLGSGTAAAATGSLPPSVQTAVHSAAASLGVSIPAGVHSDRHAAPSGGAAGRASTASNARVSPNATIITVPVPGSAAASPTTSPATRSSAPAAAFSVATVPASTAGTTPPATNATGGGQNGSGGQGTTPSAVPPTTTPPPVTSHGQGQGQSNGHPGSSAAGGGSQNRGS